MSSPTSRLVVKAGGVIGTIYALETAEVAIGRDPSNDIVIPEADISRHHARFVRQGEQYLVEDLGSTNGTYVNGQRLNTPRALRHGDEVRLGPKVVLVYEQVIDVERTVAVSAETLQAAPPPSPTPPPAAAAPPQRGYAPPPSAPPPPAPLAPKRRGATLWIILGVLAILALCVIVGALWYIDANRLWCVVFPFLFPGACP